MGATRIIPDEFLDHNIVRDTLIKQRGKESTLKGMCMEREDGYGALNYLDTDFISLLAAVEMEHEQKVKGLEEKVERLERMVEQLMNK